MAKPLPQRLMLVDGHSVAFRAYYALPDTMHFAGGGAANAFYGFVSIVARALADHAPTHLAITFDVGTPFRVALYPGYKASRDMGPEDLEPQVAYVRALWRTLRAPLFEADTFEADDVLATLTRQARAGGAAVDVLSGDLDVLQLVGPNVRVITPGRTFSEPVVYDEGAVQARYGIPPARLRDWKALVGDTSDEVPGVAGIGKKTATDLLQKFATLDDIYNGLERITSARTARALAAGRDSAYLSRTLVTLRDDAPLELDLAAASRAAFDGEAAFQAVRQLGFGTLADRIRGIAG